MVVGLTTNVTYFALVRLIWRYKDHSAITGLTLICGHISTALLIVALKKSFGRKRPSIEVTRRKHFNPLLQLSRERPWSFPSGDSAQAGCWSGVVGCSGVLWGWAVFPLAMFARVYYGAHYVLDTLVGASVGLSVSIAWHYLLNAFVKETPLMVLVCDWFLICTLPFTILACGYEFWKDYKIVRDKRKSDIERSWSSIV